MPFTGDFRAFDNLARACNDLANPAGRAQRDIAVAAKKEIRGQLREQFARGEGAYGALLPRKDGRPALRSRKLPQDFSATVRPGGVLTVVVSRAPWLLVHQEGHVFRPRSAGGQVLTFNQRGRLLRRSRIKKQKLVFDVRTRAHSIRQRVLPARPMIPEPLRGFPLSWSTRIGAAAGLVMARWAATATR